MHLELLDHCPTWRRSHPLDRSENQRRICALGVPPQNAGHDLTPTPGSEGWTDGKSVCRMRFLDTDFEERLAFSVFQNLKLFRH